MKATYRGFRNAKSRKKRKSQLIARDGARCAYCGATAGGTTGAKGLVIDHIVAASLGGLGDLGNLQLLCEPCNTAKSRIEERVIREAMA